MGRAAPKVFPRSCAAGLVLLSLLCAPAAFSQSEVQTAPTGEGIPTALFSADRLPLAGTWETAGVEGGIPKRTKICADVTAEPYHADNTGKVGAASAIQQAIDACAADSVVFVPAGTYKIDQRIRIRTPITLRGAGSATTFLSITDNPILMGGLGPWPPPKNNPDYFVGLESASRGATSLSLSKVADIKPGMLVMIDEEDDPDLVWAKNGGIYRSRASLHMVEAKTAGAIKFRPPLPIAYTRSPRLSWFPGVLSRAGVEDIKFVGNGTQPGRFIEIQNAWNVWVTGSEFSNMPSRTIVVGWAGHVELRKNHLHDQSNGGPNSEGIDLLADVNWSLIVDNICSAAGFPAINIGDAGASENYSGGFGNVIAYNYCVDSYYTDPPTSPDNTRMAADIGANHSPHTQYNLFEGNIVGKFGADGYHGSGSHAVIFRNVITGKNKWEPVIDRTAVQIDRRNLYYSIVGNVLGQVGSPAAHDYLTTTDWKQSSIYRLGYPDIGNNVFAGTHPALPIPHADGGPRDLFVDRTGTASGTTLIEGNWSSVTGRQDWSVGPVKLPDSMFLTSKPYWLGDLAWPPVDPARPVTDDPTIIPAGYRFVHGKDPQGIDPDRR